MAHGSKIKWKFASSLVMLVFLAGCGGMEGDTGAPSATVENPPEGGIKKAYAIISPTKNSNVHGRVIFTEAEEGIRIVADVTGLIPGPHGFHIHEHGDCSSLDGSATGGHFNPRNAKHGGPDSEERHVGDLGNLIADEKGHAHYDRVDNLITLNGEESIVGRSIVVHSEKDDFVSQPAGNSGRRLACGIIQIGK